MMNLISVLLALLALFVFTTIILWPFFQLAYCWSKGIPIVLPAYPFIGNLIEIKSMAVETGNALEYSRRWHWRFGGVHAHMLGHYVRVSISDPAMCKTVLTYPGTTRTRLGHLVLGGIMGEESLLLLEQADGRHAQARKVFGPAFQTEKLRLVLAEMGRTALTYVQGWAEDSGATVTAAGLSPSATAAVARTEAALAARREKGEDKYAASFVVSMPLAMQKITLSVLLRTIFGQGSSRANSAAAAATAKETAERATETATATDEMIATAKKKAVAADAGSSSADVVIESGFVIMYLAKRLLDNDGHLLRLLLALPPPLPAKYSLLDFLPTPANLRRRRHFKEADALVGGLIDRVGTGGPSDHSLLGLAVALAEKGDAPGLHSKVVRHQALTFLLAGHETTATLLTWTFHLLAQNPDWQDKVRAEVMKVCGPPPPKQHAAETSPTLPGAAAEAGEDSSPDITLPQLDQLRLLRAALHESLRLYPPAPLVARRVGPKGLKLGPGLTLLPGMTAVCDIYALHTSERHWDRPAEFDPSRWKGYLAEGGALATPRFGGERDSYSFLPFGAGPRSCIGRGFALLEAQVVAAQLLRHYSFAQPPKEANVELKTYHMVTLAALDGNLPLVVTPLYSKEEKERGIPS